MGQGVREKIDRRGRKLEDRRRKTGDRRQEVESDCRTPCPEAILSKGRTCCSCACARWLRMAPSVVTPGGCCRHLICINHPEAPGEFREVLGNGTCPNFRARREAPLRTPPPEPPNDSVKYITLTQGKHALVDAADFDRLNRHKWFALRSPKGSGYYAARWEAGRMILMHREIMNAPDDMVVDHVNRCPSDNRQCNLRLCTKQQNVFNRYTGDHSSIVIIPARGFVQGSRMTLPSGDCGGPP